MIVSTVGRKIQKILFVFNMLLAGLGIWVVFDAVSCWVSPPDGGKEPASNPKTEIGSTQSNLIAPRSLEDYELVSRADIFKTNAGANPSEVQKNHGRPDRTSQGLKLKGTILGDNAQSYAVIEDEKTKTQLLYSLNEWVHGARILSIAADHVILSTQGKTEVLMLSKESEPETLSASPPPRRPPPGARSGRGNRESRASAAKAKLTDKPALESEQDAGLPSNSVSPSEGEPPGAESSQTDVVKEEKPEDRPSQ